MHDRSVIKTHLLLILATFFWGITPVFIKLSLREIGIFPFSTLRLLAALLTSGLLLIVSHSWKKVEKKDWKIFIITGLFGFFIFQLCFPPGVRNTSVSIAAIIMATLPINVVLINLLSKSETITLRIISGIMLSIAGAIVIIAGTNRGISLEGTYTKGVLLLIAGEMAYALYTVKSKPLVARYSLYQIMTLVILFSFIPFSIISFKQILILPIHSISPLTWIGIFFTGIFGLCLGNIFWYRGIKHLGSTKTSIYANLPPVFGILSGFLFLKESLSLLQIAGGIIITAGVVLVNKKTVLDENIS